MVVVEDGRTGVGQRAGGGAAAGQSTLGLHPEGGHRAPGASVHHQGATLCLGGQIGLLV